MRGLIKDERGQAAVELVIVLPVMAMLLVILVDALVFLEECARFDHLAPQAVLAQAGSSASVKGEQAECAAAVASVLDAQFPGDQRHVVVSTRTQGPAVVYECTLSMSL